MREELNKILSFINEALLTNSEWLKAEAMLPAELTSLDEYKALLSILQARSGEGNSTDKLKGYFTAKGVDVSSVKGKSYNNILIGVVLE